MDSPLNCPHDLSNMRDFRDDLPTVLGKTIINGQNIIHSMTTLEKETPSQAILASTDGEEKTVNKFFDQNYFVFKYLVFQEEVRAKLSKVTFLGPFERYKLVRPYIQEEERKALEEAKNAKEAGISETEKEQEKDAQTYEQRVETVSSISKIVCDTVIYFIIFL